MAEKIKIPIRSGDDHKIVPVSLKISILESIERLAQESNHTNDEIIGMMLEHCVKNAVIAENDR